MADSVLSSLPSQGEWLRTEREARQMTQLELAVAVGVPEKLIQDWEAGSFLGTSTRRSLERFFARNQGPLNDGVRALLGGPEPKLLTPEQSREREEAGPLPLHLRIPGISPRHSALALARALQSFAAEQIVAVRAGLFRQRETGSLRCRQCELTWLSSSQPRHLAGCFVGRAQTIAREIEGCVGMPSTFTAREPLDPISTEKFVTEWARVRAGNATVHREAEMFAGPGRIHEVPPQLASQPGTPFPSHPERSDARGRAEAGRAAAEQPGTYFAEPWAWDPAKEAVVDDLGNTVAQVVLTDLEVFQQEEYGRRIAACVSFCREIPNDELRRYDRIMTEAIEAEGCEDCRAAAAQALAATEKVN